MTKVFKSTTLILATLLLSVVVSGCIKKPTQQPIANTNQNVNAVATTTTEIDTSDWKTYRNEEYGFEFRYPEDTPPGQELVLVDVKLDNSLVLGGGWLEVLSRDESPMKRIMDTMIETSNDAQITYIEQTENYLHVIIGENEPSQRVGIGFHQIISPVNSTESGILLSTPIRFILVRGQKNMVGYWNETLGNTNKWNTIFRNLQFK